MTISLNKGKREISEKMMAKNKILSLIELAVLAQAALRDDEIE